MTIYHTYRYDSGGYGDFIRCLLSSYVYCKLNNIQHRLFIPEHRLNECLECIRSVYVPLNTVYCIDRSGTELVNVLNLGKEFDIMLVSNVCDAVPFDDLKPYLNEFKEFAKLTPLVSNRINYLKESISNIEYTAIQIRFGDRFMECKLHYPNYAITVDPESANLLDRVEASIKYLKDNYNLPIVLFTDVQSQKTSICEKYGLLSFNTEIHQVASSSNKEMAFVDTVAEFELLGRSKAIIKFANSGFVYWSAFMNNVPLYICDNDINISKFEKLQY